MCSYMLCAYMYACTYVYLMYACVCECACPRAPMASCINGDLRSISQRSKCHTGHASLKRLRSTGIDRTTDAHIIIHKA